MLVSGVPLTPLKGPCWFLGGEVSSASEIQALIHRQVEACVDFIKVFVTGGVLGSGDDVLRPLFSGEDLSLIVNEAHQAGRRVIPPIGHSKPRQRRLWGQAQEAALFSH